jgi:phosphatidylinositol glycan class P protein
MGLCYVYVALAAYNTGYLTLGLGSVETIIDDAANVAVLDGKWRDREGMRKVRNWGKEERRDVSEWKAVWSQGTDAVMDVPLGGVCEVLYGEGRKEGSEDEYTD